MNDIGFSFLSNPSLDVTTTTTSDDANQNSTNDNPMPSMAPGLVHHQTKLDVFIIKAFSLLSGGAIVDSNNMQISGDMSQSAAATTAAPEAMNLNTGAETLESVASNIGSDVISEPTPNGPSPLSSIGIINSYSQYAQIFGKVSVLYNAILSTTPIDEGSTSSKSSIELFQRFKQIVKELCLNYDMSPYARYFNRIDQNLLQVKPDSELDSEDLWDFVTKCILSVYDPKTGQLLAVNSRNRRAVSSLSQTSAESTGFSKLTGSSDEKNAVASPQVSPGKVSATSGSSSSRVSGNSSKQTKKPRKRYTRKKHPTGTVGQNKVSGSSSAIVNSNSNSNNINGGNPDELSADFSPDLDIPNTGANPMNAVTQQVPGANDLDINMNMNSNLNMNVDTLFPQILQRRLQNIPQDIYSRPLTGYYTQPTSPGSDGNNFNLGFIPTDSVNTPQFDNFGITLGTVPGYGDNGNNSNNTGNGNGLSGPLNSTNAHQQHLLHPHGRPTGNNLTGTVSAGPTTPQGRRRSRNSLNASALDDPVVDELFQFANLSRKQKVPNDNANNSSTGGNTGSTQRSVNTANNLAQISRDNNGGNVRGVTNDSSKNINRSNDGSGSNNNNNNNNSNRMGSNGSNNSNAHSKRGVEGLNLGRSPDADSSSSRIKRQDTRSTNTGIYRQAVAATEPGILDIDRSNSQQQFAVITALERTTQQLKETYQAQLAEKDQRIKQLEKELKDQQQETEWLRKMLVGDIGYIRGLLQNAQK